MLIVGLNGRFLSLGGGSIPFVVANVQLTFWAFEEGHW